MQIRVYQESDETAVIALWNLVLPDSAPHNDPAVVIRKKLAVEQDLFFVATLEERVVGTVMGGYDGHRGWIYSVAVDPAYQRQGIGSALLHHVEGALIRRDCLKVNLQVRASNAEVIAFYRELGYEVEERVSMGKRLYTSLERLLHGMEEVVEPGIGAIDDSYSPEAIRKRPGMYLGGMGFHGFHFYLISMISLLLAEGATQISVTAGDSFEITSDAAIPLERNEVGRTSFEGIQAPHEGRPSKFFQKKESYACPALNGLSRELSVSITSAGQREELHFTRGVRTSHHTVAIQEASPGTMLRFIPDSDIFTVTRIDPVIFSSYLRRLSLLHSGVRFSLSIDGETSIFHTDDGMTDLFTALSTPYQLMHAPIRFTRQEEDLTVQLMMGYHSGGDNHLWCFINRARAADGGTHEQGLKRALKRLRKHFELGRGYYHGGVVAVMSIHYPKVWCGDAARARVSSVELKKNVSRLVVEETLAWLREHPDVAAQIGRLRSDHFPVEW